jgi:hypothetical protein
MKPEHGWKKLAEADIKVLPSNKQHNSGMVVNKAISYGCCIIEI